MSSQDKVREILKEHSVDCNNCEIRHELDDCFLSPHCSWNQALSQLSALDKIDPIKLAEIIDEFVEKGTYQQLKDTKNLVEALIDRKDEWLG